MLGRKISLPINIAEARVDATDLAPGKYMVRLIVNTDKVLVKEFVIQR